MANRFIDTGFYKSPFVRGLQGSLKALYSFIICDCNGSGIWAKDLPIASEYIGFKITETDFDKYFVKTGKAIDLKNGKYFFPDFIQHQYPKGLSDKNIAHTNFILELKKYNVIDENLKPLQRVVQDPISNGNSKGNGQGDGIGKPEKTNQKIELILPFDSEKFISTWKVLCGSKKWKGKSIEALQASLLKLSENSEKDAIQMMLNSIAGEWQGIFELKNNNNGKQESGINKNQHLRDKIRTDFENKVNERFSTTPTE